MTVDGHLAAPAVSTGPAAEALRARLEDPRVAAALNELLDRADVIAFLVEGLEGFLRRGEVIADSLADALGDLRGAGASGPIAAAQPVLRELFPRVAEPETLAVLTRLVTALGDAGRAEPAPPAGARALLRGLRDPDTLAGLGFLLRIANALGRGLRTN